DAELDRARSANREDTRAETDLRGSAIALGRPVDRAGRAVKNAAQQRSRAVVVFVVEQIVEGHLGLDAEALPATDGLDGPAQAGVEGEEVAVAHLPWRGRLDLEAGEFRAAISHGRERRSDGAQRLELSGCEQPRAHQGLTRWSDLVAAGAAVLAKQRVQTT